MGRRHHAEGDGVQGVARGEREAVERRDRQAQTAMHSARPRAADAALEQAIDSGADQAGDGHRNHRDRRAGPLNQQQGGGQGVPEPAITESAGPGEEKAETGLAIGTVAPRRRIHVETS